MKASDCRDEERQVTTHHLAQMNLQSGKAELWVMASTARAAWEIAAQLAEHNDRITVAMEQRDIQWVDQTVAAVEEAYEQAEGSPLRAELRKIIADFMRVTLPDSTANVT